MPRSDTSTDMLGLSIRLKPADLDLLESVAKKEGIAMARLVRQMVEDSLHLMSLPKPIAEVLEGDMAEQGMSTTYCRNYLVLLLTQRYGQILAERAKKEARAEEARKAP